VSASRSRAAPSGFDRDYLAAKRRIEAQGHGVKATLAERKGTARANELRPAGIAGDPDDGGLAEVPEDLADVPRC